jgi:uncharacterized repeat protein (TIGR01451 family)
MTPSAAFTAPRVPALGRALAIFTTASLLAMSLVTLRVAPAAATTQPTDCGVRPIDLVFVIDRSGSMSTNEGAHTRLGWAKLAATGLVDALNNPAGSVGTLHQVGVSSFGGTTTTRNVQLGASNAATVNAAINGISANGGTPFDIGMAEGADNMLDGDRSTYNGVAVTQVIIFLSDGNPDPDSYTPNSAEITSYLASADKAYAVAIGPDGGDLGGGGTGVSYALMRQISKPGYVDAANPGGFRAVTSGSGLPNLFAEIYEQIACPTGKIEVTKSLNPTNDPGRFDLWIDGTLLKDGAGHGGTTGEQTLNAGTYAFAESADGETSLAAYTSSASCVDQAKQNAAVAVTQGQGTSWSVALGADADLLCTITNVRKTGMLTINKVVTNDDGGAQACPAFGFRVNGGSTTAWNQNCSVVMTLPTGSYSVVENAAAGYATTYANSQDADLDCAALAVMQDANVTCTVTNDDQPGTLTVIKNLTTDDGSQASCDDFSFKLNGGSAIPFEADCSNSLVVDAGTYSVAETNAAGFTTGYANCSGLQIANGGSTTCTISNDDQPGTLTVIKQIRGGDLGCDDFSFMVNGGSAISFEADCSNTMTVPAGAYTVSETAAPGYDRTYENCSQIWIDNGGKATCTITNERQTGTIEVVKSLSPSQDPGRFDLLVDDVAQADGVGDGGTTGSVVLETGMHTIGEAGADETEMANYASAIECRSYGGEGGVVAEAAGAGPLAVNVTDGANIRCVISNTRVSVGIDKASDMGDNASVEPGETIHFTLTVTVNDGTASGVVVTDELPHGLVYVDDSANPSAGFSASGQELTWTVGSLAKGEHAFEYDAMVAPDAEGSLENLGCVDADQNDELVCDSTTTLVQHISIHKSSGVDGSVLPGTIVDFTLTLDVSNGPIDAVSIVDQLPEGIGDVTDISDGGTYSAATNAIMWTLSDVADGETLTYKASVSGSAAAGEHTNVARITDGPCVGDDCDDDETVVVRVPTLVVEKVADTDVITISGPADDLEAAPAVVTWTISWTLTDGPVTNAVITDELPDGLVFLDASDGGILADGTVTWTFATLTESGSVTLRTTVDPEAIGRAAPTVNVAVIDSDETPASEGSDSVTVSVVPPPLGGNPTPKPQLPDTAMDVGIGAQHVSLPLEAVLALFVAALGLLALANGMALERKRRR